MACLVPGEIAFASATHCKLLTAQMKTYSCTMSADIDLENEIFCHCGKRNYESLDMYMFVLRSLKNTGVHFEPKALLLTMHFRCVP